VNRGRASAELAARVREALGVLLGAPPHEAGPLVVATSGGLDSMVLAHLLRFGVHPRPAVVLAHFDAQVGTVRREFRARPFAGLGRRVRDRLLRRGRARAQREAHEDRSEA